MFEIVAGLFDTAPFAPKNQAGWTSQLLWLHAFSDLMIWLAFVSIPLVLLYFTRRRDLPFPRLFVLFALFILACGTTHLIAALTFEYPVYRFEGVMKAVTAVLSWVTVIALIPVVPRVMTAVGDAAKPGTDSKLHRALSESGQAGWLRGYVVAILAGVLAILVRAAFNPLLKNDHIFVVSLLAVVYVSWQFGFRPAIVTLLIGIAGFAFFFIPPRNSLFVEGLGNQLAVALFFFCGVVCAALGDSQRNAQRRARAALASAVARQEELESEVVRRRVVEAALRQREAALVISQREAAEALARLNAFLDNAPVGIAFLDPNLRYVQANRTMAGAHAVAAEAHVGRTVRQVVPDFPEDVLAAHAQAAEPAARPVTQSLTLPDPNTGEPRTWNVVAFPVRTTDERLLGLGVIAQDTTDRLKAEEELRRSEKNLSDFFENANVGLHWVDSDGIIIRANQAELEMLGYTREEYIGRRIEDFHDSADVIKDILTRLKRGERLDNYEARLRCKDGSIRDVLISSTALMDAGHFVHSRSFTRDVTALKEAERTRARLAAIVESSQDAIISKTLEGVIVSWNAGAERLFGYTAKEAVGQPITLIIPLERHDEERDLLARLRAGKRIEHFETVRVAKSGRRIDISLTISPVRDELGKIIGASKVARDITELKRAEEELRRTEERFRLMAQTVPSILWTAAPDGTITWVSDQWLEYCGITREQNARGWPELVLHPDDHDRCVRQWSAALAEGTEYEIEVRNRRHDGVYRWFLTRAIPVREDSGVIGAWFGVTTDIHDQKMAVEAVRESEAFRRSVFENTPDCAKIMDRDGRLLEMNGVGRCAMELDDFEAVRGTSWAEMWPEASRETIREVLAAALAGEVGRFQGYCPTAKGTLRYWDVSVAPLPGADGKPFRLVGVSRDITEQRRAEDAVRASEARFRTLTETVPQVVWTADPRGEITFFNRRWDELTGVPLNTGRAGGWGAELLHPDDADRVRSGWERAVAQQALEYTEEFRLRRADDGEYRWMLSAALPLRDRTGGVTEWVGTLTDIDDQKRQTARLESMVRERTRALEITNAALMDEIEERKAAEQQVRDVATELERSNDELEKFAYIASHDLQEPLRKIQAFGDRLLTKCRTILPDNGKEYVDRMMIAAGRMRRLIDDLLTFSRVTTQQRPFARLDLEQLVREVVSDLDVGIAQAGGTVEVGSIPAIDADPSQMRQLFQNLIVNGVKFHRPGVPPVVEIRGELVTEPAPDLEGELIPQCRITVRDNGIGFDEKYRERIFEIFQRLHGRDEYEGSGIGLAICRKIVERHGGTITAHGRKGEGATLVVTLPARQSTPREVTADDEEPEQTDHDSDG